MFAGGSLTNGPPTYTVELPISIDLGVKKVTRYYLNLNVYRNLHYQINNKLKVAFKDMVVPFLVGVPPLPAIRLEYDLYLPNRTRRDLMNCVAVVDKFFCDVLTSVGILEDDCIGYLDDIHIRFAGYDKIRPRVVATIIPV